MWTDSMSLMGPAYKDMVTEFMGKNVGRRLEQDFPTASENSLRGKGRPLRIKIQWKETVGINISKAKTKNCKAKMKKKSVLKNSVYNDLDAPASLHLEYAKTLNSLLSCFFSPRMKSHHYMKNLHPAQVFVFRIFVIIEKPVVLENTQNNLTQNKGHILFPVKAVASVLLLKLWTSPFALK